MTPKQHDIDMGLIRDGAVTGPDDVKGKRTPTHGGSQQVNDGFGLEYESMADITGFDPHLSTPWTYAAGAAEQFISGAGHVRCVARGEFDAGLDEIMSLHSRRLNLLKSFISEPGNILGGSGALPPYYQAFDADDKTLSREGYDAFATDLANIMSQSELSSVTIGGRLHAESKLVLPDVYSQAARRLTTGDLLEPNGHTMQDAPSGDMIMDRLGIEVTANGAFEQFLMAGLNSPTEQGGTDRPLERESDWDSFAGQTLPPMSDIESLPQDYPKFPKETDQKASGMLARAFFAPMPGLLDPEDSAHGLSSFQLSQMLETGHGVSSRNSKSQVGNEYAEYLSMPDLIPATDELTQHSESPLSQAGGREVSFGLGLPLDTRVVLQHSPFASQLTGKNEIQHSRDSLSNGVPYRDDGFYDQVIALGAVQQRAPDSLPALIAHSDNLKAGLNPTTVLMDDIFSLSPASSSPAERLAGQPSFFSGFDQSPGGSMSHSDGFMISSEGRELTLPAAEAGPGNASGAPGWLTAFIGAVLTELTSASVGRDLSSSAGSAASPRSQLAVSGTPSDPVHVKLVGQAVAYGTHMPAGPTSHMPSQSLPVPGQVLFSQ